MRRAFITTYGRYQEVSPYRLFKANQNIQDWPRQDWIKLTYWAKEPGMQWQVWKKDCTANANVTNDLAEMARNTGSGWGLGIGSSQAVLRKALDPPSTVANVNIPLHVIAQATARTQTLDSMPYTQTLCGQCVVV